MRALVFAAPGVLELAEVADPTPEPGEVIIEVEAAGVCGTDHHLVAGELGVGEGMIPGHETAGRIAAIGDGVRGWSTGDRVVSYGQVVCGVCDACVAGHQNRCTRPEGFGMARPGGFADAVAVAATSLVALPEGVDPAVGAIATDAIATPLHALSTVGNLRAGETVVIIGIGGLGMHAVLLAAMMGAGRIVAVDTSAAARELALALGADDVIDPAAHDNPGKAIRHVAGGAQAAFEFVGRADTVEYGLEALAPGGRLVVVGVGHARPRLPPIIRFIGMELTVAGSFGSTLADIATVLDLIERGRLDTSRSVARRIAMEDAPGIFDGPAGPARAVIVPGLSSPGDYEPAGSNHDGADHDPRDNGRQ